MRRFPALVLLLLVTAGPGTAGCDRVAALKDRILGASGSEEDAHPELEAIRGLYESGNYDGALQRIAIVVQEQPDLSEAYYYRGRCHLALAPEPDWREPLSEDERSALEAFQRALSINPRHAPSSIGIGDVYSRRIPPPRRRPNEGDPQDAEILAREAYERAVTIDPGLPEAQHRYATFLERSGDLDEAERAYRAAVEAVAVVPEIAPDYYLAYGRFLAGRADRLDEALDQFELARVFRQDDAAIQQEIALVHSRVGHRHFERQEYLLAEEALTRAFNLFPDKSVEEARQTSDTLAQLRSIRRR